MEVLVRQAARALARAGLVHAYGHCSVRLDSDRFLVCAAKPMGMIRPSEPGAVVPIDGPLPDGVLGEVRIHQQIYRNRPEVGGVCRTMPPSVMALSALGLTPRARHGFGAYFAPAPALWEDPLLVRDDARAQGVAKALGQGHAVVMRGNGAVTAAESLERAVVLAWYLEDAARVELAVRHSGLPGLEFTAEQAAARATDAGRIFERMWEYLTDGDPEQPGV